MGYFGLNCSALCGHCTANHSCHHETGECMLGCENGWTGITCVNKHKGIHVVIVRPVNVGR